MVPQSTAATGPTTIVHHSSLHHEVGDVARRELLGRPTADGVVTARQLPGQVGVQALHPPAGAADAARGSRPGVTGGSGASRSAA